MISVFDCPAIFFSAMLIAPNSFASKVEESANGARYKSQGQARSEAERVAPGKYTNEWFRPERPKYVFALSGLDLNFDSLPGATRFALAPGLYISRRWRCVATFGAKPRRLAACQNLQCSHNPTGLIMAARFLKLPGGCYVYQKV